MSKDERDLFDILGISTHEDSYTTLLATIFEERQEWAKEYFERVLCLDAPDGPVEAKTRLHLKHEGGRKADIPDLVFTFGHPITDIWVVEAKIKSGESSDQLRRYEGEMVRNRIFSAFGVDDAGLGGVRWHYSYLSLEGETPTSPTRFRPITYEPLREILPANPDLATELFHAHSCLRSRFVDYYKARDEVTEGKAPSDSTPLEDYLNDAWGLIDERNKFHWLMERIAKDLGEPQFEFGIAQNRAFAKPMCRTRNLHWQGEKYGEDKASLRECFDIHLELQLISGDSVSFVLHYETNPYMPGLNNKEQIPGEQRRGYWELRREFAEALGQRREELEDAGWKLTVPRGWGDPPPISSNQLAKRSNFDLSGTVGNFQEWVAKGSKTISPLVNDAIEETFGNL